MTRDVDIAILSVRSYVCPSVRDVPVLDENGLTYCHNFFYYTVAQSFYHVILSRWIFPK